MDPISDKLFKVIEAELPYREENGGYTKYGDWYGKNVDDSYDFTTAAWCDMLLAWAADQVGVAEYAGQFAYTPAHANWFKQQGAWTTKPEPGAFVFYNWSGSKSVGGISHVGIVEKVSGTTIYTIEGNTEGVHLKRKVRDTNSVVGYGLPRLVKVDGATYEQALAAPATGLTSGAALSLPAPASPPTADTATMLLAGAFMSALVTRRRKTGKQRMRWFPRLLGAGATAAVLWATPAVAFAEAQPYGVDVSNHDQGFDWSADGLSFGIAKASEGTTFTDATFARNWTEIKKNGLVRGAYHFGRPGADPVRQADRFVEVVKKQGLAEGDLLVLDLEVTDGRSAKEVNTWATRWLERVYAATGVKPIFYSSWSFAQTHGDGLGQYPLWVAHYGKAKGELEAPRPWKDWAIHQYASTDHDHNVANLSPQQLRELGYQGQPMG